MRSAPHYQVVDVADLEAKHAMAIADLEAKHAIAISDLVYENLQKVEELRAVIQMTKAENKKLIETLFSCTLDGIAKVESMQQQTIALVKQERESMYEQNWNLQTELENKDNVLRDLLTELDNAPRDLLDENAKLQSKLEKAEKQKQKLQDQLKPLESLPCELEKLKRSHAQLEKDHKDLLNMDLRGLLEEQFAKLEPEPLQPDRFTELLKNKVKQLKVDIEILSNDLEYRAKYLRELVHHVKDLLKKLPLHKDRQLKAACMLTVQQVEFYLG